MMMCRKVNMPIDLLFCGLLESKEATYGSEYVAGLQDKLKLGHERARIYLKKGAEGHIQGHITRPVCMSLHPT